MAEDALNEHPEPLPILTLKEKMAEVAADCGYVRKDGVNQFHKYNYATAASIFEKVGESLYKHRLLSTVSFEIVSSETRTNDKGKQDQLVTVKASLSVNDLDSEVVWLSYGFGSGMDNGDKAVMKAQTAALKYAWMMGLNISTGDDPEADAKVDARAEGKAIPREAPRGPYKPSDNPPIVQPEEPDDPGPYDDESPAIFDPPSGPPMTKAELAAAAGHAVIERGGSSMEAVSTISKKINESLGLGTCKCGSPLTQKFTSKAKGSKRYMTCELNDKAFRKENWAVSQIEALDREGVCGLKDHTWQWA